MSYCVHCGVELAETEKHCPLCGTEVLNPNSPWVQPSHPTYPRRRELPPPEMNRRFLAVLLSVLWLIPIGTILLVDIMLNRHPGWSVYANGALLLFYFWFIFPLYMKKPGFVKILCLGTSATVIYLFIVDSMNGNLEWLFQLGIPLTVVAAGAAAVCRFLFRNGLKSFWTRAAAILLSIGFGCILIEEIVRLFLDLFPVPTWSIIVWISCTALAICLLILRRKKRLLEKLERKLYF